MLTKEHDPAMPCSARASFVISVPSSGGPTRPTALHKGIWRDLLGLQRQGEWHAVDSCIKIPRCSVQPSQVQPGPAYTQPTYGNISNCLPPLFYRSASAHYPCTCKLYFSNFTTAVHNAAEQLCRPRNPLLFTHIPAHPHVPAPHQTPRCYLLALNL